MAAHFWHDKRPSFKSPKRSELISFVILAIASIAISAISLMALGGPI